MAVQGNLKDMGLTGIVQTICAERRKVSLVLRRGIEKGIIFFEDGEIVHASLGSLEGEEAVYRLLGWMDGTFRISNHVTTPRRTVTLPWSYLLLEGMRLLDEQQAREAAEAQGKEVLSPAEIKQDSAMENELILLLSKLEQMQVRLANEKAKKQSALALQMVTEMVNQVVVFSETWLDRETNADSLAKALAKAGDVCPAARLLQVQHNRLSVEIVSKLYSSWSGDMADRQQMFHEIAQSMLDVLETYFSLFTARFRSSSVADQWRETCGIFLADLTQMIDKIHF
jgi:hypothetical protein